MTLLRTSGDETTSVRIDAARSGARFKETAGGAANAPALAPSRKEGQHMSTSSTIEACVIRVRAAQAATSAAVARTHASRAPYS